MTFVTMAERGAVLAMETRTRVCEPTTVQSGNLLGAGAIFSANIALGVLRGIDGFALLERTVRRTSRRLALGEPP